MKSQHDTRTGAGRPRRAAPGRPLGRRPKEAGGGPETRAAILDAAMELFAERGFDGTPVKTIAASAGVATGLIFHYFGAKEGLLTALIDERTALPLLSASIEEIAAGDPRVDAAELLMRVGRSAYLTARHSAPMLRIMVREILQRDSVRAHWDEARQSAFTVFARALAGATGNSSRSRACSAIARTFLDTVLFEALFGPAMDADALIASIVGTISLPGPGHASDEVGKEEGMDP